jgi:hypothetical protein
VRAGFCSGTRRPSPPRAAPDATSTRSPSARRTPPRSTTSRSTFRCGGPSPRARSVTTCAVRRRPRLGYRGSRWTPSPSGRPAT